MAYLAFWIENKNTCMIVFIGRTAWNKKLDRTAANALK